MKSNTYDIVELKKRTDKFNESMHGKHNSSSEFDKKQTFRFNVGYYESSSGKALFHETNAIEAVQWKHQT